jgi:hypothetical protein
MVCGWTELLTILWGHVKVLGEGPVLAQTAAEAVTAAHARLTLTKT